MYKANMIFLTYEQRVANYDWPQRSKATSHTTALLSPVICQQKTIWYTKYKADTIYIEPRFEFHWQNGWNLYRKEDAVFLYFSLCEYFSNWKWNLLTRFNHDEQWHREVTEKKYLGPII